MRYIKFPDEVKSLTVRDFVYGTKDLTEKEYLAFAETKK